MSFEKDLQRGFNAGYILEMHHPALSKKLKDGFTDKEHPYVQGFFAGSQELASEKERSNSPILAKYMQRSKQQEGFTGQERGKDEQEIER